MHQTQVPYRMKQVHQRMWVGSHPALQSLPCHSQPDPQRMPCSSSSISPMLPLRAIPRFCSTPMPPTSYVPRPPHLPVPPCCHSLLFRPCCGQALRSATVSILALLTPTFHAGCQAHASYQDPQRTNTTDSLICMAFPYAVAQPTLLFFWQVQLPLRRTPYV